MKYIDAAMERLRTKKAVNELDLSLVERILAKETDGLYTRLRFDLSWNRYSM